VSRNDLKLPWLFSIQPAPRGGPWKSLIFSVRSQFQALIFSVVLFLFFRGDLARLNRNYAVFDMLISLDRLKEHTIMLAGRLIYAARVRDRLIDGGTHHRQVLIDFIRL